MPNFQPKDSQVLARQLKVERLVIPFSIVGNATSTSVVASSDEPSLLFFATEGVDGITAALSASETATFTVSPNDTSGIFNVLLKTSQPVVKVCALRFSLRDTGVTGNTVKLGSATGITTGAGGGSSIMATVTSSVTAHSGSTLTGCLEVDYSVGQ